MANDHGCFWLGLLNLRPDPDQLKRLWNGYLAWKLPKKILEGVDQPSSWPQLILDPPDGGWPTLTDGEKDEIDNLAEAHGGHREFTGQHYMDLQAEVFSEQTDFSGLTLVCAKFDKAEFRQRVSFDNARFFGNTFFMDMLCKRGISCCGASFDTPVWFDRSQFESALFIGAEFRGGASFSDVRFNGMAMFNDSRFEDRYYSKNVAPSILVDFRSAKFMGSVSFREVLFGYMDGSRSGRVQAERRVDFSNAEFRLATSFRKATFGGAPAFFNTTLHEDTDFSGIDWTISESSDAPADYTIRAWERLELIMSELQKPLDRHQFFRLKMRARRRVDPPSLKVLNWLFEGLADYGWGVRRTFIWWIGHWTLSGLLLFAGMGKAGTSDCWRAARAALATAFANAHSFLLLGSKEGYLAECRQMLKESDEWGLLTTIGTVEAVLGPVFLFFLLLTLRNRFRLA